MFDLIELIIQFCDLLGRKFLKAIGMSRTIEKGSVLEAAVGLVLILAVLVAIVVLIRFT